MRVRLQRAAELLAMSELTLEEIASRTGFAYKHYLASSFRQAFGMTPGTYRRQAMLGEKLASTPADEEERN
jgi:transcriptional regulator GlxA family with amidase domain